VIIVVESAQKSALLGVYSSYGFASPSCPGSGKSMFVRGLAAEPETAESGSLVKVFIRSLRALIMARSAVLKTAVEFSLAQREQAVELRLGAGEGSLAPVEGRVGVGPRDSFPFSLEACFCSSDISRIF
jgi:hypothetical protein